jgi:hypothetical protein
LQLGVGVEWMISLVAAALTTPLLAAKAELDLQGGPAVSSDNRNENIVGAARRSEVKLYHLRA